MERTHSRGVPPDINGKSSQWATVALIEHRVAMVTDDVDEIATAGNASRFPDDSWVRAGKFYCQCKQGKPILVNGLPIVWPLKSINSAIRRGTMRPDVAIIDPVSKTWRQAGQ